MADACYHPLQQIEVSTITCELCVFHSFCNGSFCRHVLNRGKCILNSWKSSIVELVLRTCLFWNTKAEKTVLLIFHCVYYALCRGKNYSKMAMKSHLLCRPAPKKRFAELAKSGFHTILVH